jgi:hypothetical protein
MTPTGFSNLISVRLAHSHGNGSHTDIHKSGLVGNRTDQSVATSTMRNQDDNRLFLVLIILLIFWLRRSTREMCMTIRPFCAHVSINHLYSIFRALFAVGS